MYCMKQRWMYYRDIGHVFKSISCALLIIFVFQIIVPIEGISTTTEGLFDDLQSLVDNFANSNLRKYKNASYMDNDKSTIYVAYANNPFGPSQIYSNATMQYKLPLHENEIVTKHNPNIYGHDLQHVDNLKTNIDNSIDIISNNDHQHSHEEIRSKRNVIQLYYMINCATGCDPIMYKGYGCFCGFLGSGYPVDGIDRCCQIHDQCYTDAHCAFFGEYIAKYYWQCTRNGPKCSYANLSLNNCAQRLCECDVELSRCLKQHYCPTYRKMCFQSFKRLFQNIISNALYL